MQPSCSTVQNRFQTAAIFRGHHSGCSVITSLFWLVQIAVFVVTLGFGDPAHLSVVVSLYLNDRRVKITHLKGLFYSVTFLSFFIMY